MSHVPNVPAEPDRHDADAGQLAAFVAWAAERQAVFVRHRAGVRAEVEAWLVARVLPGSPGPRVTELAVKRE